MVTTFVHGPPETRLYRADCLPMRRRRTLLTAVIAATALALPAAASAATVTVTGDAGQPLPLTAAGTAIRNMSPVVTPAFTAGEKRYAISVVGPDGVTAASIGTSCIGVAYASAENVKFLGNGTYTVS